jgi:hypothetical protein
VTYGYFASGVLFALRHRATGAFMPQRPTGRGYTFWEPRDEPEGTPRLFTTRRGAQIAAACWARGEFHREHHPGDWGFDDSYYDIKVVIRDDRQRDDLEIVPVRLTQVPDTC